MGFSSVKAAYNDDFAHMAVLDSMPAKWRALAYEYGFRPTEHYYCEGVDLKEAAEALEMRRAKDQAEHLRLVAKGAYKIPKSAFFSKVGGFRSETDLGAKPLPIRFSI
jgi:hypothetical protein